MVVCFAFSVSFCKLYILIVMLSILIIVLCILLLVYIFMLLCMFCSGYSVSMCSVLFVCKFLLYYCHWESTQLQLTNISVSQYVLTDFVLILICIVSTLLCTSCLFSSFTWTVSGRLAGLQAYSDNMTVCVGYHEDSTLKYAVTSAFCMTVLHLIQHYTGYSTVT